ncbi:hypothetical protein L484_007852 [Morus notabilis]|uniref:Serine/threonine-protein kinase ATM n=1 Tax=Morus notabilis TaxID=981085 RepID=W9RJ50_9ROSA|nr:hypothetical protein L484_007852 [Morus notabilis]
MTAIVTSRDVQEIVSKLSSDKAKAREEGIKLLNTWLEGERSIAFCKFLGKNTAKLNPNDIRHCKRRLPKLIFAKTLRIVVQRAQDSKFSDLVLLYMDKVESSLDGRNDNSCNPREEVFRCILTLQSLLENPPGDFLNNLRENIVKGFVGIFSYVRFEDKLSRKLIECINKYLLKDGPNLGHHSMEIHGAVQQFVFRCWLTTHDRALKDALILYARLQLNLTRGATDGNILVEQLLDIVCKELDQSISSGGSLPWVDTSKDEKFEALSSSQYGMVDLTAAVLYQLVIIMCSVTCRSIFCSGFIMPFFPLSLQELSSVLLILDSQVEMSSSSSAPNEGDIRDILHLRKSLLKAVLGHFNWQESSMFNEHLVLLLPAAVYSLSTGCAPFKQCHNRLPPFYAPQDVNGAMNDWVKAEELEQDYVHELFECSIEVLVNIDTEQGEGISPFPSKVGQHLLELLDRAVDVIQSNQNDLSSGCFSYDFFVGDRALVTSFGSFVSSPLFVEQRDQSCTDIALYDAQMQLCNQLRDF